MTGEKKRTYTFTELGMQVTGIRSSPFLTDLDKEQNAMPYWTKTRVIFYVVYILALAGFVGFLVTWP